MPPHHCTLSRNCGPHCAASTGGQERSLWLKASTAGDTSWSMSEWWFTPRLFFWNGGRVCDGLGMKSVWSGKGMRISRIKDDLGALNYRSEWWEAEINITTSSALSGGAEAGSNDESVSIREGKGRAWLCVDVEVKERWGSSLDWPGLSDFFLLPVDTSAACICILSPAPSYALHIPKT